MPKFTNFKMTDMHFVYGRANGNLSCYQIFVNIHRYIREKCSFVKNIVDLERCMTVRTSELEEAVPNEIKSHPETRTR